ncbi:MAG: YfiR family protein [Candidatus Acidiferrales bacterium]
MRRPSRLIGWMFAILFLVRLVAAPEGHAQEALPEYQVKAAYLFNFLKFVEWPDDAFSDSLAPFVIGIAGDDPFGESLPQVIIGKTVQGRDLVIRKYHAGENMRGCHILFIDASEKKRLPQLVAGLKGSSVLIVSDMARFLNDGGMIQFLSENNRVRFAINVDATGRANLKVSSKLLSLARVEGSNVKETAK